jgi:hypothetical protein
MDTRPVAYYRHRLVRFAKAIEDTRNHFGELSAFGRYSACSPYYERSGILLLLNSIKADPGTCRNLIAEFEEINTRLGALEQELGDEYRRRLRDELSIYTDSYHSAVCQANLGLVKFETDYELFHRDHITVLVRELEKDHDLGEVKNLIRMLDQNLFQPGEQADRGVLGSSRQSAGRMQPRSEVDRIES